jgi:serine/threonine-protein kinase
MVRSGQRVGEYVLEERIGGGAFGSVWRAHHHAWVDQIVAVKIPADPAYVRSLQDEGYAVHGLHHPNIARAIGFDPYATVPYLVTEYVPGTSLRPLIESRSLSVEQSVEILTCVLEALSFAHERNVVHRDVKPENILIHEEAARRGFSAEGMVKLTDFGLGQKATSTQSIQMSMQSPAAPEIAGTVEYMSPEQRRGDKVDARADVYACGVILFEMLTGSRPGGIEMPSELNPQAPRGLDEVYRRAYARLETRFASAKEMLDALQDAMSAWRTRPATLTPPPIPPPIRSDGGMPSSLSCPRCGKRPSAGDQFCIHCGQQLVPEVRRCPSCGFYPEPNDRFCLHCGRALLPTMRLSGEASPR